MPVIDFNDAGPQRTDFEPIPAGTIVKVVSSLRPGKAGDGGWLTKTKAGDGEYLSFEFTVVSAGSYANRKFWQNMSTGGGKVNEKGESIAWNITKGTLRAMLNSAKGFNPEDDSEAARAARKITSWGDLDGLEFVVKVGIEAPTKDQAGNILYAAKNKISSVIEPGHKDYDAAKAGQSVASAAGAATHKPAWATSPNGAAATGDGGAGREEAQQSEAGKSTLPAWAR